MSPEIRTVLIFFALLAQVFWLCGLLGVLQRRDEDFPGRNDKLMWFILVFFGNFLGVCIYWLLAPEKAWESAPGGGKPTGRTEQELSDFADGLLAKKQAAAGKPLPGS